MTLILKVHISDIHLVKLNLQITPETVLIQGQPSEAAGVGGYFLYLAPFSISFLGTGFPACSTRKSTLCGTGRRARS